METRIYILTKSSVSDIKIIIIISSFTPRSAPRPRNLADCSFGATWATYSLVLITVNGGFAMNLNFPLYDFGSSDIKHFAQSQM